MNFSLTFLPSMYVCMCKYECEICIFYIHIYIFFWNGISYSENYRPLETAVTRKIYTHTHLPTTNSRSAQQAEICYFHNQAEPRGSSLATFYPIIWLSKHVWKKWNLYKQEKILVQITTTKLRYLRCRLVGFYAANFLIVYQ